MVTDLAPGPVFAATLTASFSVTATISSSCQTSVLDIVPGSYISTRARPTSTVSVNCTKPTQYNVSYTTGPEPSVTVTKQKATGHEVALGTGNKSHPSDAISGHLAEAFYDTPGTNADLVAVTVTY
jgi:spore coat protein U-like protein